MRVTIAFYFYCGAYNYLNLFGIGRSTVWNILHTVGVAIAEKLSPKIIHLHNEIEVQILIRECKEISGFPQAAGAIDRCHIRIKTPLKDAVDYISRKDYHSIALQGLADNNYMFRDVFVGWPGEFHDARIFKIYPLYEECIQGPFLPSTLSRHKQKTFIPPLILGDSVSPLEKLVNVL